MFFFLFFVLNLDLIFKTQINRIKPKETYDGGHERRFEPTGQEVFPVNVPEERLLLDIFRVPFAGS